MITEALEMKGDQGIIHLENSMDGVTSNVVSVKSRKTRTFIFESLAFSKT